MSFILRLTRAFRDADVRFAVTGGYAVAFHGAVRGTLDVDIVVRRSRDDFVAAEETLKGLGLAPRLPVDAGQVFDFREEFIRNRNLVAWSFSNPSNPAEIVDVIITHDLAAMKVVKVRVGNVTVPVVSRRDLIAMKRASGRPQDLEDVRALEALG
jgi:hypothetical protein